MQGHMGKYQVGQEAERAGENVNTSLYSGFYRLWENWLWGRWAVPSFLVPGPG